MKKLLITSMLLFCVHTGVQASWSEYSRSADGSSAISLSDVTLRVREIVDDPNSVSGTTRYSSDTIHTLVNTANRMFCINSRALETYATQQLVLNTTEYALPTNMLYIERVTLDIFDDRSIKNDADVDGSNSTCLLIAYKSPFLFLTSAVFLTLTSPKLYA